MIGFPVLKLVIAALATYASWWMYQRFGRSNEGAVICLLAASVAAYNIHGAWVQWQYHARMLQIDAAQGEVAQQISDSHVATFDEVSAVDAFQNEGVFQGAISKPTLFGRETLDIFHNSEQSILVTGKPGVGKSTSLYIPTGLLNRSQTICYNDPKAEIWATTHAARKRYGDVYAVCAESDWFHNTKGLEIEDCGFNPYYRLDPEGADFADELRFISHGLLPIPENANESSKHFMKGARRLHNVLAMNRLTGDEKPTLVDIRKDVMRQGDLAALLASACDRRDTFHGLLADDAESLLGTLKVAPKEMSGFITTLTDAVDIYAPGTSLGNHVSGAGFDPAALKGERMATLYFVVNPKRMVAWKQYINFFFGYLAECIGNSSSNRRVTVIIDEAFTVGNCPAIQTGLALYRSFGYKVVLSYHSIAQAKGIWGNEGFNEIKSYCDTWLASNVSDNDELKLISELSGNKSYANVSSGAKVEHEFGDPSFNLDYRSCPVWTPAEVRQLPASKWIAIHSNAPPMLIDKVPFYSRSDLNSLAGCFPHGE